MKRGIDEKTPPSQELPRMSAEPPASQQEVRYKMLFLGGAIGLMISVLGNLIATWIQQDLLQNTFTPQRVLLIAALTVVGMLVAARLELNRSRNTNSASEITNRNGAYLSGTRLWWSRLKSRGRDVAIHDVSAVKSEIDIDTRDHD